MLSSYIIAFSTLLLSTSNAQDVETQTKCGKGPVTLNGYNFRLPAETERHKGTIIAWPTKRSILDTTWSYPGCDVEETRKEMAELTKAIAEFEPVELFVLDPAWDSDMIDGKNGSSYESAMRLLKGVPNINFHVTPNVDSLWTRDTGPVFVYASPKTGNQQCSEPVGALLSFDQWGRKNLPTVDSYFGPAACDILKKRAVLAPFIAEGGGIELDGEGTMLATESAILNPNRNPGVDKKTMEGYFAEMFGVKKTIWIPGFRGGDVTDDHIDGLARFGPNGLVLVTKPFVPKGADADDYLSDYNDAVDALRGETDAKGRKFRIVAVPEPDITVLGLPRKELEKAGAAVEYVNFHAVNGGIILAAFGDKQTDKQAADIVGKAFPGRKIRQVHLRQLAIQGGGIHCATQPIF